MSPWQRRFHEALDGSGRSRHTVRAYRQHVERFVRWWEESSVHGMHLRFGERRRRATRA